MVSHFRETIDILVELNNDRDQELDNLLFERLEQHPWVLKETVTYQTKAQALEFLQEDFGKDIDLKVTGMANPLHDVMIVNLHSAFVNADSLEIFKQSMIGDPAIFDVYYKLPLISQISTNVRKVSMFSLIIAFIVLLVTIALVNSTVRLSMYSDRFLIKNMQMVGAEWKFIRAPYLSNAFVVALISGLIAIFAIFIFWIFVRRFLPDLNNWIGYIEFSILSVILLLIGSSIVVFSTYRSVNKYLRMKLDDLY